MPAPPAAADVVHVLPHANGGWVVRVGDDADGATQHPTANLAEREAVRRAVSLGIEVVQVHDRYSRVRRSRVPAQP